MWRKEMSTRGIRDLDGCDPDEAAKVRALPLLHFFRVTGLTNDGEPVGAQGVPLTPGRSIAVDRVHYTARRSSSKPICRSRAQGRRALPPPDDRAGYRLGDRRPGARRSLSGRRRRGRPHRRPHPASRPLLDAAPARARHRRRGGELPLPVPKPNIAEDDGGKADTKPAARARRSPPPGRPRPLPASLCRRR